MYIVIALFSVIERAKPHLTLITKVGLFGYVIYFAADAHGQQCGSAEKKHIAK